MTTTFTVIATPFRASMSMLENQERLEACINELIANDICDFETVLGVYHEEGMPEASREVSLMIKQLSWSEVVKLEALFCETYQQDCILVRNEENNRCALKGTGWTQELGFWTQVTKAEAQEVGIYTFDTRGNYWMAK